MPRPSAKVAANEALQTLICNGNKFAAEGIRGLSNALKQNCHLREIHLEDNNIGER